MKENVGHTDRVMRTVAGAGLLLFGYARLGARRGRAPGALAIAAGVALLESAVTRVCPINTWLGIDSRSTGEAIRDWRELTELGHVSRAM